MLGETWGFGEYLWHTLASIVGGFGFWIALCYAPSIVNTVVATVGIERPWWIVVASRRSGPSCFAWEAWYPRIWLWTHAGERLDEPDAHAAIR